MFRGSTPRLAQIAGDLGFAVQFYAETPLSGRIVPRVTKGKVTPFIHRERHNVKHSIAGYLRLPRPTPAPALMMELHWHRS